MQAPFNIKHLTDETITLKEVLSIMDSAQSFSISFVTADRKKQTGGEWITIPKCWKHDPYTSEEKKRAVKNQPISTNRKNPNHYLHATRNLRLPTGEIRKVHIRLITFFNGKLVT